MAYICTLNAVLSPVTSVVPLQIQEKPQIFLVFNLFPIYLKNQFSDLVGGCLCYFGIFLSFKIEKKKLRDERNITQK